MNYLIEVVKLVGVLVVEFGEDVIFVKCVGLLYDIGKVVDYEVEGFYVEIGVELIMKYKESFVVINMIVFYYGDVEVKLIIVVLVVMFDLILVVWLGVWSELLENYIYWFEKLEVIVNNEDGVKKSYVI